MDDVIAEIASWPLDRSRPLWEMVLLDGLADDGWALLCKTHHCLVDGVGSLDLLGLILGAAPAPPQSSMPASADGSHARRDPSGDRGWTSPVWRSPRPAWA